MRFIFFLLVWVSSGALAQTDARVEVRAAFEDQAPLPSVPLALPRPQRDAKQTQNRRHAAESAGTRADDARSHDRDTRGELGLAGKSATGQARAEEVRKNNKNGKPPRPPKP